MIFSRRRKPFMKTEKKPSIGKVYTAVMILQLGEEGPLS